MSVDISDPQIQAIRAAIHSKSDPTTWFLLQYNPSTPSPTLQVLSSGIHPAIPQIQDTLYNSIDDVVFGYAEISGKGMVLAYLKDNVGGVRRARAVVHSRAVASLFPDYSALITIAHPSQLTDDLVIEKLGLNQQNSTNQYHSSHSISSPSHPHTQSPNIPSSRPTNIRTQEGQGDYSPSEISPPVPEKDVPLSAGAQRDFPNTESSQLIESTPSIASQHPVSQGVDPRFDQDTVHRGSNITPHAHPTMTTPSGQVSPSIPHNNSHLQTSSPIRQSPRIVSAPVHPHITSDMKPISSTDFFPPKSRSRKTSLGSRLGHLASFGKSSEKSPTLSSQSPRSPPHSPGSSHQKSPSSPTLSKFKNSSLLNFGRRTSGGVSGVGVGSPPSSPNSPNKRVSHPPPVPPKNLESNTPIIDNPTDDLIPERKESINATIHGHNLQPVGAGDGRDQGVISHSPSAQQALFDISQRNVRSESEIQERFRKDLEEKERLRSHDHVVGRGDEEIESDDEDIGLPYDREPEPESESVPAIPRPPAVRTTSQIPMLGAVMVGSSGYGGHDGNGMKEVEEERELQRGMGGVNMNREDEGGGTETALRMEEERFAEEQRTKREEENRYAVRVQGERLREEEKHRVERERLDRQLREEERLRVEQEETLRKEEEARRLRAEEQAQREREEEELRIRREEERLRIDEEERARVRAEEEEERLRLEEERRRKEVEDERRRVEEEERYIQQMERQAREEEERKQRDVEEKERKRVEDERKRKEGIISGFSRMKDGGGQMLSGWVTVQTTRSTIWRRRWFSLFGDRMDLYKNEGDQKPIQVIHLRNARISQSYEESQVQGSFKITTGSDAEEFFLFADSAEDKEMVLSALKVIIGG